VERILTKEEISELLSAVRAGDIDTDEGLDPVDGAQDARKTDLIFTQSGSRSRIPNLDILLDSFARHYGMSMSNRLQYSVNVKRGKIEYESFGTALQGLQPFSILGILQLDPLKHGGLLIFDSNLSFSMVELMLGGSSSKAPDIQQRVMTAIELNVVRGVMDDACVDISKCFEPVEDLTANLLNIENNPRMVSIVPPETETLICSYSVSIEKMSGTIKLMIPYVSLEPLREKLKGGLFSVGQDEGDGWKQQIHAEILQMDLNVAVGFPPVTLSIRDILNFQIGDIIDLQTEPEKPLQVFVETCPKYRARAGLHQGRKAVRILPDKDNGDN